MGWACGIIGFIAGLYWMAAWPGAQAGAQVVAQLVPQEDDFFLKQSNSEHFLVEQPVVEQAGLQTGAQTDLGAQPVLQAEDLLHLKQSNRPFLWPVPHPAGAQLVGVAQTGLHAGPQFGAGAQLVEQEDFLHLKQSNKPFFPVAQPLGAQLAGVVQAGLHAGPQFGVGAQLVEHAEDLLPFRQSNKPHFFLGWDAHATGGLHDFVVAHPLSQ